MDTKNILTLGVIALGGYLIYQKTSQNQNQTNPYYNYPQIPQAPVQNTPQWQHWVAAIIGVYDVVSDLWQPGGPFHNTGITPQEALSTAELVTPGSASNILYGPCNGGFRWNYTTNNFEPC